jgi:hypothetical protein
MPSLSSYTTIQQAFIAYYQRPADPGGLRFWADRLEANGGDINEVIDAFGTSQESEDLYGPINTSTIGDVIDSIYLALFNREPDAAGKQFYIDGFNNGTYTAASIAYNILVGAQNSDAVAVTNKTQVSMEFTQACDGRTYDNLTFGQGTIFAATYAGEPDAIDARGMLADVTSDPTTVLGPSQVVTFIQQNIADPGDPILNTVPGQSWVLTPTVDLINGTTGNDQVTGVFGSATPAENTYTTGDSINGGGGTDSLVLTAAGTLASPTAVTVKGIANVNIRDLVGSTFDATLVSDNPAISFNSTLAGNTSKVVGGALGSTYGLAGGGNMTVDFASTSGSSDTAKVSLAGAGTSSSTRSTVDVADGNTIEAVSISATGTNFVTLNAGTAATKVTLTGAATNTIAVGSLAAIATIDASTSTGTNTFLAGNSLNTGDTVKGGTGADTLSANFTSATLINPTIADVETLSLDFDANAILNLSKTTGATTLAISGSKGSAEVTNAGATITKLNLSTQDTGYTDNDLTFTHATGVTGALTFTVGSTATSATNIQQDEVVLKGVSDLTLTTVGTKTYDFDDLDVYGDPANVNVNVAADNTFRIGGAEVHGEIGALKIAVGADATYSGGWESMDGGIAGGIDYSVAAGAFSQSYVEAIGGDIGDVTYSVTGRGADGNLGIGVSGGSIGDMTLTVDGARASGYFGAIASGGSIGDINITQTGSHSVLGVYVSANAWEYSGDDDDGTGNIGNITIDVNGTGAYFSGYFTASGGDVGDVSIAMTDVWSGNVYVNAVWLSGDTDNDGSADDYVRGGNVGDVTVDINGVLSSTDVVVTASGGDIGNVTYSLAGTGASGGLELYARGFGTGSIGSGSPGGNIGFIDIQLGDDTLFSGNVGMSHATGPISITAGDNVSGRFSVSGGGSGTGAMGDLTLVAGDDTEFYINVEGFSGSTGALTGTVGDDSSLDFFFSGATAIGPVTATAGSSSDVEVQVSGWVGELGTVTLIGGANASGYVDISNGNVDIFGGIDATQWTGYLGVDLAGVQNGSTVSIGAGGSEVSGSSFADNIFGGAGVDTIFGDNGDDLITGAGGNDVLKGGAGKDTILGDAGNDTITGGADADSMGGGAGTDTFVIGTGETGITVATADSIGGFATGADKLKLGLAGDATAGTGNYVEAGAAAADFTAALAAANTALAALNGTSAATQLYAFQFDATNGYLFEDTNSDGTADQVIVLVGITNTGIGAGDISG